MKTYYIKGSTGDCIYCFPSILSSLKDGEQAMLYLRQDYYNNLYRLISLQKNIIPELFIPEKHKDYICLDFFRDIHKKDPCKLLTKCFLELAKQEFDLTKPWLFNITPKATKPIIVNVTSRYHSNPIQLNWNVLKKYRDKCIFLGDRDGYKYFKRTYGFDIDMFSTKDMLEVAEVISGSSIFVGNQSSCFAIAEGLKHTRIIERCLEKDNCYSPANNCFDYLTEELIERFI